MRALIVEDEASLVKVLARGLRERGFAVDVAHDGEEGLHFATAYDFDVIILDLMLPKLDGYEILSSLREAGITTPVLILSALDRLEDKVKGFQHGSDDYMTKPFAFQELSVRVDALIRRSRGVASRKLLVQGVEIDLDRRTVTREGREIPLTATEFKVIEYLALHCGHVISRTELTEHIWSHDAEKISNVIDVHVRNLRRKLAANPDTPIIETVWGTGYRMRDEG